MNTLTKKQEARIYCVKNGHASYISHCFGYIHCGRCGDQIGDQLAGCFDTTNMITIGHNCDLCNKLKNDLSELDKQILHRLENSKDSFYDYEQILAGITLP